MNKCAVAFGMLVCLTAVAPGRAGNQAEPEKGTTPAQKTFSTVEAYPPKIRSKTDIPTIIKSPSSAGEVRFPHQKHFAELGVECKACHHEINTPPLKTFHKEYFRDFWVNCKICHHEPGKNTAEAQACSSCHHTLPMSIADQTLSAKVVIHKSCFKCHAAANGAEASKNCKFCHKGPGAKF